MRVAILLALAACNQLFGVDRTHKVDAAFFDAPLDAAPTCPMPGVLPKFKGSLNQVNDHCIWYTIDEAQTRDVASCATSIGAPAVIADGSGDGVLTPVTLSPPLVGTPDMPRLSPEGDELWLRSNGSVLVYAHSGDHTWTFLRDLGVATQGFQESFSPPSRWVAGKRHFMLTLNGTQEIQEWEDDGTNVTLKLDFTTSSVGSSFCLYPTLSADGLRMVWSGALSTDMTTTSVTLYADRMAISDSFSQARVLTTAPVVLDAFLTSDCGRIYTSGLGSIFFAEQQ